MVTEVQTEEFIKKDDILGKCKSYHIEKSKCNFPDCETQIDDFCNEQMELITTKDIPGIKKSQRKFKKKLKKMNLDHYFIKDFEPFGNGSHEHCGNPCNPFGNCRICSPDLGHLGWHKIQDAARAAKEAAEKLTRQIKAVERFDIGGEIINKLNINPQALLNKLNLQREFKKIIKNLRIEDLVNSLKQPIEGVKNEVNKIPQNFEKIVNEIGEMGKNLPKLLRLDKVGDGILKLLKQMFGTLMDAVSPFFKWIINVVIFMLKPFARIFLWFYKKLKVKTVFGSIYALMFMMIFLGLMSDIWSIYSILMRVVNNILPVMKI